MPQRHRRLRVAADARLPQPGHAIPGLHALPRRHPRLEYQPEVHAMTRAWRFLRAAFVPFVVCYSLFSFAQQKASEQGVSYGNYFVKQSFDFGYRYASVDGSTPMYNTM